MRYFDPFAGGGGYPPPGNPPSNTGANTAILSSTGGLNGFNNKLLVPVVDQANNTTYFVQYDPEDFNSEVDCVYNFRLEDIQAAHNIDVHCVYLTYRDLGKVTFSVAITAESYNKTKSTYSTQSKSKVVSLGIGDGKLHSYFVDLKIIGERPQLSLLRKANAGPLAITRAILIGHQDEGQILA